MAKAKCNKCDWETTKETEAKASSSLKMHVNRKHKGIGPQKGVPRASKTTGKRKYTKRADIWNKTAAPDDSAAEVIFLRRENQRLKETILNLLV